MSVPWWVYLISLPMVLLGVGIHFVPLLARRLAENDRKRQEELVALGLIKVEGEESNE
jgi:hypothetical protein